MAEMASLYETLKRIDGKPYGRFRELEGTYSGESYTMNVQNVQGSPHAEPTSVKVTASLKRSGFPDDLVSNGIRRMALADVIARRVWETFRRDAKEVSFQRPHQEILERGSARVLENHIELLFGVDLPNAGKNAAGRTATDLFQRIDSVLTDSLDSAMYKMAKVRNHADVTENAEHIREQLDPKGLVAFIANGSVIPRREDGLAPLSDARVFSYDASDKVSFEVPNGPPIEGLGIRKGFTVIIGPTGSGRSSLLDAVVAGVHDHIPGDGREYVITKGDAVFISKHGDIHCTADEGRTAGVFNEAAAISDAVCLGASLIMMDEDSSSPQIMRSDPMFREITCNSEPIVPVSEMKRTASFMTVSNSDSVLAACDDLLVMSEFDIVRKDGEDAPASLDAACGTTGWKPLARDITVPDTEGMGFPNDPAYGRSLKDAICALEDEMDGTAYLDDVAGMPQPMSANSVRVRPMDIAMTLCRCGGITMIRAQRT